MLSGRASSSPGQLIQRLIEGDRGKGMSLLRRGKEQTALPLLGIHSVAAKIRKETRGGGAKRARRNLVRGLKVAFVKGPTKEYRLFKEGGKEWTNPSPLARGRHTQSTRGKKGCSTVSKLMKVQGGREATTECDGTRAGSGRPGKGGDTPHHARAGPQGGRKGAVVKLKELRSGSMNARHSWKPGSEGTSRQEGSRS